MRQIDEKYRPVPEQRRTSDRTEPAIIGIRTQFMYPEPHPDTPADKPRRIFCYASNVTHAGDFADDYVDYNDVWSTTQRMIRAFGDDADLEIVVRRRS